MKLFLFLLLLLSSPGVLTASPLPDILPPPPVPALSLPPLLPLPLPAPHELGDLARDRLGKMAPVLLTSVRVSVGGFGKPVLPPDRAKAVIAALSDLVLDDSLYVRDAKYDRQDKSRAVVLEIGEPGKEVTVSVWRDKPLMTITRDYPGGRVNANYLPVLPEVVKLLQAVDPDDPGLNMTLVKAPPPLPSTKGIPGSVLTRIATLKPGMTRAGVLYLFMTEGGVSTTYWNHYVYRKVFALDGKPSDPLEVPGGLVKVNIDFAPPDANIVWLAGRGFWLGQYEYQESHDRPGLSERPGDIVLQVSPPYVQYMIVD